MKLITSHLPLTSWRSEKDTTLVFDIWFLLLPWHLSLPLYPFWIPDFRQLQLKCFRTTLRYHVSPRRFEPSNSFLSLLRIFHRASSFYRCIFLPLPTFIFPIVWSKTYICTSSVLRDGWQWVYMGWARCYFCFIHPSGKSCRLFISGVSAFWNSCFIPRINSWWIYLPVFLSEHLSLSLQGHFLIISCIARMEYQLPWLLWQKSLLTCFQTKMSHFLFHALGLHAKKQLFPFPNQNTLAFSTLHFDVLFWSQDNGLM